LSITLAGHDPAFPVVLICLHHPKTASVHVSRILAKLGVVGHGEAAAIAHRLGLDKR
jgi:DNA-binding CsgD family transcriptional regulator